MKILVLGLAAVAWARPDIGISSGYHYQVPATSYGVPSGSVGNLNRQYYQQGEDQTPQAPSTSFETPIHGAARFGGGSFQGSVGSQGPVGVSLAGGLTTGQDRQSSIVPTHNTFNVGQDSSVGSTVPTGQSSTFSSSVGSTAPGGYNVGQDNTISGQISSAPSVGSSIGSTDGFNVGQHSTSSAPSVNFVSSQGISGGSLVGQGQSSINAESRFSQNYNQQAEVQKHLYFYTAPEEPEEFRPRVNLPLPPPKKNIRILFIKAPTYSVAPIQIPLQAQNEEKTLVYVLVKRPDEQQQFDIPTPEPTQPAKPEVYFIKYKSQKEADEAINSIQSGSKPEGVSVSANSVDDNEFISNIGNDVKQGGISFTNLGGSGSGGFGNRGSFGSGSSGSGSTFSGYDTGSGSSSSSNYDSSNQSSNYDSSNSGSSTFSQSTSSGSSHNLGSGSVSSTTPSYVNSGSSGQGSSGIHQLYGPPKAF